MKANLTIAALIIAAMVSCAKDDSSSSSGSSENIAASFTCSIATRATGVEWEAGDQIGIMATSDNTLLEKYHYNNCHNVSFSDATVGIFTPDSELDQIYYPIDDDTTMIEFYAYYPYDATLSEEDETYPIDVTDQTTPSKIDFMEASTRNDGSGGYNRYSGAVALDFSRNMSKVTLEIKAGEDVDMGDITDVTMPGFYTSATYDFPTNSFYDFGGDDVSITPYDEGGDIYSAILIPENTASHKACFKTSYSDVEIDLTSYELSRGEHLYFTVTVNRTNVTYEANTINEWNEAKITNDTIETE